MGNTSKNTGKVKFFNGEKGYGFIVQDSKQPDLFVHISNVNGDDQLRENDEVSYDIGEGKKGPCAENVTLL